MKNSNNNENNNDPKLIKKEVKINSSDLLVSLPLDKINSPRTKKSSSKICSPDDSLKSGLSSGQIKNAKLPQKNNNKAKIKNLKSQVFDILSKDPDKRNSQEILIASDYLSKNYKYFIDLKKNDAKVKVEMLAKICKLEIFKPGDTIILYGDIGDKFYIVLEGLVEIYIPEYSEKEMTPFEFLQILDKIKRIDQDLLKYERLKLKNNQYLFESYDIKKIDTNTNFMRSKFNFIIENDDKKGEYGEGFSFGEIALIKKTRRNATIKSADNTICLSISKNEYNEAMNEIESKKLVKEIESFKKTFQFFNCINNEKMITLFNNLSKIVLYRGDYLYRQNDINEYIYLVVKGSFEVYSYISYSWLNEYYDYIEDSLGNILYYMISNNNLKYNELQDIIKNIKINAEISPMKNLDKNLLNDEDYNISHMRKKIKDNLLLIKNDEEHINDKKNIFRIDLNKVDYTDIFGLEDSFDFKKKFFTVKITSKKAELKCIKVTDFLKVIWNSKFPDLLYFLKFIINKKYILKNKIINSLKNLEKKILFGLDIRYENLINYNNNLYNAKKKSSDNKDNIDNICLKEKLENNFFKGKRLNKKKENELNRVVSAIKIKGYKMSIQDLLDTKINILSNDKTENKKKIFKNNNSINLKILNNIYKARKSNPHLFKFKKKIFYKSFSSSSGKNREKNESFSSSPGISKKITNYTSFRNYNNKNEISKLSNDNCQNEEINNNNLEKNIIKLNKTNNLLDSMSLFDKIVKTPNYLCFSSMSRNKKQGTLYKNNKNAKNIFNSISTTKINNNRFLSNINYNILNQLKSKSIETPPSRLKLKNKTNIFNRNNNLRLLKRNISISHNTKDIEQNKPNISLYLRNQNKKKDIFNTIRKGNLTSAVMDKKLTFVNDDFIVNKQNSDKFYFKDDYSKITSSRNIRNKLESRHKTFIKKKIKFSFNDSSSQKDMPSHITKK